MFFNVWRKWPPRKLATQKGYKTRFFSAADLVLMLEAAQRQGRYREVMPCTVGRN